MKGTDRKPATLGVAHASIGLCLALAAALGWPPGARAELLNWQCEGAPVVEHDNLIAMDLAGESQAGDTAKSGFDSGQRGTGRCNCPSSGSYYSYFTALTQLPVQDDGWLKLNDYIDARVSLHVYGPGHVQVPFYAVKNAGTSDCTGRNSIIPNVGTGSRGEVTFRLRQGIVGEVSFSGRLATLYWQLNYGNAQFSKSHPFAQVNAVVRLKAIASCEFRAGDTFTIDLGEIDKAALTEGGMPKQGYTPPSIDLSLDCVNLGGAGAINYMFQSASGSEGNLLLTDLRGLGIGLRDGDDNPVGLGMENAIDVPVVSNTTSFLLKPYPTKLPGQAVESGRYNAQAIVTLSLP